MTITDILRQYGVEMAPLGHEHARPGWTNVDCPWCSKGWKHYRLGIALSSNACNCWACGPHSTIRTLMELTGEGYNRVKELLGVVGREEVLKYSKPRGKLKVPSNLNPLFQIHENYLRNRGFDPNQLQKIWGLQGIGISKSGMSWRIFIPIFLNWEMVSWTTRTVNSLSDAVKIREVKNIPRYRSASLEEETIHHKHLLYGEDYARHAIIIVEGPTDVWAIGPGAVATLGVAYTKEQVLRMVKYPVRVVCFDNEAQRQADRLCSQLEGFPGHTYRVVLSGKDPAASPKDEIQELRDKFLSRT